MSWFVGYRDYIAIAAIESGKTPQLSAAALAGAFFPAARPLTFATTPVVLAGAAVSSCRAPRLRRDSPCRLYYM